MTKKAALIGAIIYTIYFVLEGYFVLFSTIDHFWGGGAELVGTPVINTIFEAVIVILIWVAYAHFNRGWRWFLLIYGIFLLVPTVESYAQGMLLSATFALVCAVLFIAQKFLKN